MIRKNVSACLVLLITGLFHYGYGHAEPEAQINGLTSLTANKTATKQPPRPDAKLAALLAGAGFNIQPDLIIVQNLTGIRIDKDILAYGGLKFDDAGALVYTVNEQPVEKDQIVKDLNGLLLFARTAGISPQEAGSALRQWGFPMAFDGRTLLNPDGTATDYGRYVYEGIKSRGGSPQISGQELKAGLAFINSAMMDSFSSSRPDLAAAELNHAWDIMAAKPQNGETPLDLQSGESNLNASWLSGHVRAVTDAVTAGSISKESAQSALSALSQLTASHNGSELLPPLPPLPVESPSMNTTEKEAWFKSIHPDAVNENLLPSLLAVLDKINGKPLTAAEEKWLIESFPMGETIWRLGVQNLWRRQITGQGVKVAVIDTGVCPNADLDSHVDKRDNLTIDRGPNACFAHATHVGGIIAALAPNARILSYRALSDNSTLKPAGPGTYNAIMKAVQQAVKDGAKVINMSFDGPISDQMNEEINNYSRQGIIFLISAGNGANSGVQGPSNVPTVISVGALDVNNRQTTFSSYGETFDPQTMKWVDKTIFMAPGENIRSTLPGARGNPRPYGLMSGTSMSAPVLSGIATLLVQQARDMGKITNPVAFHGRTRA